MMVRCIRVLQYRWLSIISAMNDTLVLIATLTVLIVTTLAFVVFTDREKSLDKDADSTMTTSSSTTTTQAVNLFYYRPQNDINEQGELQCTEAGLVAVQRDLIPSEATVKNTINLLLDGDLYQSERQDGIITEFPLPDVRLVGVLVDNGVAVIALDDPEFQTGGGTCRANVLRSQVEQTALQFSSVSTVRFLPDTIFQP